MGVFETLKGFILGFILGVVLSLMAGGLLFIIFVFVVLPKLGI